MAKVGTGALMYPPPSLYVHVRLNYYFLTLPRNTNVVVAIFLSFIQFSFKKEPFQQKFVGGGF